MARKRTLFVSEAVTLAHVARPLVLAGALDSKVYDITFACSPHYAPLARSPDWQFRPIYSIDSRRFLQALAKGNPVYDSATLRRYVADDLALIQEIKPDLIVGDFRLSLSVSARLVEIPYMAISNAYWSPYSSRRDFPLPVLPITRILGSGLAAPLFRLAQPAAFALHCLPLNRVRREHGLPSLGYDLRRVYTDADHTLYADVPELFPTRDLPPTHHYLGPILWSPPQPEPDWWNTLPQDRPIVYVTLGSSGDSRLLPAILEALAGLDVTVMAATAGAVPPRPANNQYIADYLPGIAAAQRAALVVCNGGSPTSQQALAAGVPVLGICSNMDQFLNMQAIAAAGAGRILRADRVTVPAIRQQVADLLGPGKSDAARRLATILARYPAPARFSSFVSEQLMSPKTARQVCPQA